MSLEEIPEIPAVTHLCYEASVKLSSVRREVVYKVSNTRCRVVIRLIFIVFAQ